MVKAFGGFFQKVYKKYKIVFSCQLKCIFSLILNNV